MNKMLISFFLILPLTHAAYAWLCPNNFKIIQAGDSMETVKQTCGKPASEKELPQEKKQKPEQWDYVIQDKSLGSRLQQNNKLSLLFDASGKLINMTFNGTGINQTSACTDKIRTGDSKELVKRNCGNPAFILQSQGAEANDDAEHTTVAWVYESTTNKTTFIFKDGVLTDRQ